MHKLYELKDMLCEELEEYAGKEMSAGTLEVVDKLSHAIKNLNKIIEAKEEEDYSGMYYGDDMSMRGSYARNGNRGGSYARGRGRSTRRDSMGRYANEGGYSRTGDMIEELRQLMREAPDEHTKMKLQRFISEMEMM